MGSKVIIAGSRSIVSYTLVGKAMELSGFEIDEIVCGKAPGVDRIGEAWGKLLRIPIKYFEPRWRDDQGNLRRQAGFERNHEMGDYADKAICVWDGSSGGTKDMIDYMKKLRKPCFILQPDYMDLFSL